MIYLDHAAATPVDKRVLRAMEPYFVEHFYNPSAAYLPAKKVAYEYESAKATIAHAIGAKATDLIMTAGATEANNLAFTAITANRHGYGSDSAGLGEHSEQSLRILYLETEHDSVRRVAEKHGGTAIRVLDNGLVDIADLKNKLTDETELISVALVNNELGTIQPLAEIGVLVRETRLDRLRRGVTTQLLLHSDASQALTLLDINVARLGVDLLTLNGAKVYGPKGVGALYASHQARLRPQSYGGGQENGLRSGTENVPGVIGFAKAVELAREHLSGNRKKYTRWRETFLDALEGYELINKKHTLSNFVVVAYPGLDAERLVFGLEEEGVLVATGAACAASKGKRSHVLSAIRLSDELIAGSLRLTLGETNDEEQIREAARIINEVVRKERARVGE